ncbi:AIM24 family protein [Streptomyces litchfieldiae]|uniref:AIM24 family protein n=1 Tax=Streptomyces litchfieldiae TaxID=3075543 RepID=A0ABU2MM51_9ACTN|nr:AIM24 family protein [Streptomyces sp. DSM 44938]MDT0342570.1 AIM24 family protein [Streptomyces sp. DSM 44938]
MQSPIFNHTVTQSQERFALQGAHMLRVALGNGEDVVARAGSMVAFDGMVEFDGEYQSPGQHSRQQWAGEVLPLMRCYGQGSVYFANLAQHVHVLDVDHEGLTVDSSYVLALDAHLHWDVISVESQYGIPGVGAYNLVITGQGKVAITTSGRPLVMRVSPDRYCSADADAVVAWSTSLRVQMQAQTSSRRILRRRGSTGEGWELNFMGDGHVVVQPSELLPPQQTSYGEPLQFRQGAGPGLNQGGAWGPR